MSAKHRLFMTSAEAALVFTGTSWAFLLVIMGFMPEAPTYRVMSFAAAVILPDAVATWWIFRRLLLDRARGDAQRGATAFAVSAPVTLAVSYPLGELVGGYTEGILGSHFILPAVLGVIVLLTIIIPGAVVAWSLHPSGGVGAVAESDQ
jgi:hypothetical protein